MKILHTAISLYPGGAEKLLVDSIPIYRQRGIDVDLLLLIGDETPFYKQLKDRNITIHYFIKGNIKKAYNPFLIFHIIPYLKKYDIIHVHLFPALYWVALAKRLSRSKIKLIFTEHNTNNKRIIKKGIWRFFDKFVYNEYDRIVSISPEVDTIIKNHLADKSDKFSIINNGIDISQYRYVSTYDSNNIKDSRIILQVAGFREQKDQSTVIRALQYLPENIVVHFVGDGVTRKQCEQLVHDLNLSNRVSFLGVRSDVPKLLNSADVIVMSSHWEGFGLAAVEGMAAYKPVVASDVEGLNEVVKGAGLLFEKGNEKDLSEIIMSLLNNDEFYKKVAHQCFERAKKYDINTMVDKYIKLYQEVLN